VESGLGLWDENSQALRITTTIEILPKIFGFSDRVAP